MSARMKVLRDFYPEARREDWKLVDAGIRVQAIKNENGAAGIVHYGTEVVTDADNSIAALLGASPGASVSASIMLEVLTNCLPQLLETKHSKSIMKQMIPTYNESLVPESMADRFGQVRQAADVTLQLRTQMRPKSTQQHRRRLRVFNHERQIKHESTVD